ICLGSRLHLVDHIAVYGVDPGLTAQNRLRVGNRRCGINVHSLPLENRMRGYHNLYQQIASGAAVDARLALIADADTLAVVNTGRNIDLDPLSGGNITGSAAVRAFLTNDL